MRKNADIINKRSRLGHVLCLSLFMLGAFSVPSFAQDNNARLNRLENEIETLNRAVYKGEMPPASTMSGMDINAQAGIEVRLSQLEVEVRSLTGRIEQQDFETKNLRERFERIIYDMEMRLVELERSANISRATSPGAGFVGGSAVAGGTVAPNNPGVFTGGNFAGMSPTMIDQDMQPPTVPVPSRQIGMPVNNVPPDANEYGYPYDGPDAGVPSAVMGQPSIGAEPMMQPPEGQQLGTLTMDAQTGQYVEPLPENASATDYYEHAFSLMKDRNYDAAEQSFQQFLERFPSHGLAANARYWLGETFYVRNNYERAARIFAEAYQQFPNSSKGPDSLLKLGMSLAGMGKKDDACLTFQQLKKEYPSGSSPVLNRAQQEMEAMGCS